jgi:hypothetical protein
MVNKRNQYAMFAFYCDNNYINDYASWGGNMWGEKKGGVRENFNISYAVDGPIISKSGLRQGLPLRHNLCNSPVENPSPLTSEGHVNCCKGDGI